MDTTNMKNRTVRIDAKLKTSGFTKVTGEDELTRTIAKMLPPELNKRVTDLRAGVNNMNSQLKTVCGRLIDHPQGGLASLKDDDENITPLKTVMAKCLGFDRESSLITQEIKKLVDSGDFRERIEQISGLDPNKVKIPGVGFGITMAVDTTCQNTKDIMDELANAGLSFPGIYATRLVPRQDEKLVAILENIAHKMGEHYTKLAARVHDITRKNPVTKEDVIKANYSFAHSLDNERDKIRIQLGDGPQMDQLDKILDDMLANGNAMIDVFQMVQLSDGTPAADAVNIKEIVTSRIKSDDDLLQDLGFDL